MNIETEFFCELMKLYHGQDNENYIEELAKKISWANGWPKNKKAFWNAEAFMWKVKIEKNVRELIYNELEHLEDNLDVGCGSYSYISSVGFDIAENMLKFNRNLKRSVQGNLEEKLPFLNNEFESATAIFLLNYIKNLDQLLNEVKRVIKKEFIVVLYSKKLNELHKRHQVNNYDKFEWEELLKKYFNVEVVEKNELLFFKCLIS